MTDEGVWIEMPIDPGSYKPAQPSIDAGNYQALQRDIARQQAQAPSEAEPLSWPVKVLAVLVVAGTLFFTVGVLIIGVIALLLEE
jgi:hypothetical protein